MYVQSPLPSLGQCLVTFSPDFRCLENGEGEILFGIHNFGQASETLKLS